MFTLVDPQGPKFPWRDTPLVANATPQLGTQLVMVHNLLVHGFYDVSATDYLDRISPSPESESWGVYEDAQSLTLAVRSKLGTLPPDTRFEARVARVAETYELSDAEVQGVIYLYFKTRNRSLSTWAEEFPQRRRWDFLEAALGLKATQIRALTDRKAPLRQKGLIDSSDFSMSAATTFNDWELSYSVVRFLDFECEDPWEDGLVKESGRVNYPLESFPFSPRTLQILKRLVNSDSGFQVLFYGRPGTGKTSLAQALAAEAGKTALFLGLGNGENNGDKEHRQRALVGLQKQLSSEDTLLIIDEADEMLQGDGPHQRGLPKAWLNDYLDTNTLGTVWIVNDWEAIHPAILRRFHYVLEFSEPQVDVPQWTGKVPDAWVPRLNRDVSMDRGDVTRSLETWERTRADDDSLEAQEDALWDILQRKQQLVGSQNRSPLAPVSQACDRGLWNTDQDLSSLETSLASYLKWLPQHRGERQPFSVLCSGVPGTGKTEWIKYQAQVHHKTLRVYRPSDLLSKWVGESEKNIAKAFQSNGDDFLLLDEVDSLLQSRAAVSNSFEITQINELLTQLENYPGVVFCATNFLGRLDEAVARRFLAKVTFRPLESNQLKRAWSAYFPDIEAPEPLSDRCLGLTAGDFRTVWARWRFAAEVPTVEQVLDALVSEKKVKERIGGTKIGF